MSDDSESFPEKLDHSIRPCVFVAFWNSERIGYVLAVKVQRVRHFIACRFTYKDILNSYRRFRIYWMSKRILARFLLVIQNNVDSLHVQPSTGE
ncbi:MAG: hypothetical protein IIT64_09180 [Bacteroidaceae bacterium]|nr:hypothetical protein [Bacteroidaceae bacterium]